VSARESLLEAASVVLILPFFLSRFSLRAPEKFPALLMLKDQEDSVPREQTPSVLLSLLERRMMLESTSFAVKLRKAIKPSTNLLKSRDL